MLCSLVKLLTPNQEDEIEPAWTAIRHDASDTQWDDYRLRDSPEINSGQAI